MTNIITHLPEDYTVGTGKAELEALSREGASTRDVLAEIVDSYSNEKELSIVLDWAYDLRRNEDLSWGDALNAALILYFG